ncbi:MAG TPA: hypothetical protein VIY47_02610, partial [Ignavibacteriaceae bacterium]
MKNKEQIFFFQKKKSALIISAIMAMSSPYAFSEEIATNVIPTQIGSGENLQFGFSTRSSVTSPSDYNRNSD